MSWNYSIAAVATAPDIGDVNPFGTPAGTFTGTYNQAQLDTLFGTITKPEHAATLEAVMATAANDGLTASANPEHTQAIAARIDSALGGIVNPALREPLGVDAMVQSPTGMGLANDLSVFNNAQDAGRTTISDQDIALAKMDVDALVKQMMAQGRSDQDIQAAVAMKYGHGDLANVAQEVANQQLGADKFNLFSNRNQEQGQEQTPFVNTAVAGFTAFAAASLAINQPTPDDRQRERAEEEMRRRPTGIPGPFANALAGLDTSLVSLPCVDCGPTTAFLAQDMLPTPNVPNLKAPGQNIGAALG